MILKGVELNDGKHQNKLTEPWNVHSHTSFLLSLLSPLPSFSLFAVLTIHVHTLVGGPGQEPAEYILVWSAADLWLQS